MTPPAATPRPASGLPRPGGRRALVALAPGVADGPRPTSAAASPAAIVAAQVAGTRRRAGPGLDAIIAQARREAALLAGERAVVGAHAARLAPLDDGPRAEPLLRHHAAARLRLAGPRTGAALARAAGTAARPRAVGAAGPSRTGRCAAHAGTRLAPAPGRAGAAAAPAAVATAGTALAGRNAGSWAGEGVRAGRILAALAAGVAVCVLAPTAAGAAAILLVGHPLAAPADVGIDGAATRGGEPVAGGRDRDAEPTYARPVGGAAPAAPAAPIVAAASALAGGQAGEAVAVLALETGETGPAAPAAPVIAASLGGQVRCGAPAVRCAALADPALAGLAGGTAPAASAAAVGTAALAPTVRLAAEVAEFGPACAAEPLAAIAHLEADLVAVTLASGAAVLGLVRTALAAAQRGGADARLAGLAARAAPTAPAATVGATRLARAARDAALVPDAGLAARAAPALELAIQTAADPLAGRFGGAGAAVLAALHLAGRRAEDVPVVRATGGVLLADTLLAPAATAARNLLWHAPVRKRLALIHPRYADGSEGTAPAREAERIVAALLPRALRGVALPSLETHITRTAGPTVPGALHRARAPPRALGRTAAAGQGVRPRGILGRLLLAAVVVA
jgi:hypothetical protein